MEVIREDGTVRIALKDDAELAEFADEVADLQVAMAEAGVTPPAELREFIDRVLTAAGR